MLFSSIPFLVFFLPAVLALYYTHPSPAYRNGVLLAASLLFYAWGEPKFVLLMGASIIFNYNVGLRLGGRTARRPLLLFLGIVVNLGILFIFKYLGFSCTVINQLLEALHRRPLQQVRLVMPIGISFYTFQEISYLVDVYRSPLLAQKRLLHLGLYITFFPQLIAGPIVRYRDVSAQIAGRTQTLERFAGGLERFIIGLAKKTLVANTCALVCDKIYGADILSYSAYEAWAACLAYSLQIYYDFSGYSDMAIGLARLFGFELPENFNYPYAASSITDFWRRWHISLTSFFRDYLYIPLGGNRRGTARTVANRFVVFLTTGLWHGAAFNFIFWGLAHGVLMTAERLLGRKKGGRGRALSLPGAFLHRLFTLLCIALLWGLFRNGTKTSVKILLKMFGVNYTQLTAHAAPLSPDPFLRLYIDTRFCITSAIGILFAFPWWRGVPLLRRAGDTAAFRAAKYLLLLALLVLCYASLADNTYNPFIYFRF